ncbi:N-acetyltransferase family protein [Paracoccus sediminis]|uniref:N-acetyltransferase family protein n=1 Tax=Paracoccus sediminis TaxID=1214787 RepID=A0A238XD77_9RHOB|nr:GNAT family N-acetyltransferase [Paracoccus sediminis]TBN49664.1 N-acetyltransferase family protein [Paracoccus sediminis]SNR56975.1 phosphinothricin acetyltransferase [Paracoccus sediminis]
MIRPASPGDVPAIAAIWNPIIRDTVITFWPTERSEADIAILIADRQAAGHPFVVACDADGISGFATYSQFRAGGGYARSMEHTIYLAPRSRGRGTGRLLLAALEDHARDRGHRILIGGITASNEGSLRFHARAGYGEWGRVPCAGWKFGRFHDLVLMGKDLKA